MQLHPISTAKGELLSLLLLQNTIIATAAPFTITATALITIAVLLPKVL